MFRNLSVARKLCASIVIMAACNTAALAGAYDRYGVSSQDVAEYTSVALAYSSCAAAHAADPDPMRPTDNPTSLLHVASLYGQCGENLKKQHSSAAVLRTNDLFLSLKCNALGSSTGVAVSAPACSARSTPAPTS